MAGGVEVILAVIAIVALTGNTLTVILFMKKSKWLKKAHNCLILALSIQDILLAVCLLVLPSFVPNKDVYPIPTNPTGRMVFCRIIWSHYIPFALGVTSVYTCLMLTIDRWMAVTRPLSYKRYEHSAKVSSAMVITPWIAGFGFEISSPLNALPIKQNNTFTCAWKKVENPTGQVPLAIFSFLGMIVIPALLMMVLYVHIIRRMKIQRSRVSVIHMDGVPENNGGYKALKRVTRTACVASTIVVICWLPDQLYYSLSQIEITDLGNTAHSVVKILAFANSCVNPFIYSFSNSAYRKGFKEILFLACTKKFQNTETSQAE